MILWMKEIPIRWVIALVVALAVVFLGITLILGLRSVQMVSRLGENLFNQYQLTLARKIAEDIQTRVLEFENGLLEIKSLVGGQEMKAGDNLAILSLFSQEHLNEIFNPFFTTKEKGTGLGLAVSLKILNDHNGELLVSSQVGEGSVFTVRLPRQPG